MEDFLESILPPFVVAFAVTATLGFLSRQARVELADRQLRHGSAVGVIGWFSLVFSIFVVSLSVLVVGDKSPVPLYVAAAFFALLGMYLVVDARTTRGYFDDNKIVIASFWSRKRIGKWTDLEKARFKKFGQHFEFLFSDGTIVKLSKILVGHRAVCKHVESLGFVIEDMDKAH